jgi:hypothetical protein
MHERLAAGEIERTAERLDQSIRERFPDASLGQLAAAGPGAHGYVARTSYRMCEPGLGGSMVIGRGILFRLVCARLSLVSDSRKIW